MESLALVLVKAKTPKQKMLGKDYLHLMDYFYLEADYLAINISSPNTEILRELSSKKILNFY